MRSILPVELNRFSLPDAGHVALVAHGDVAVVAAQDHLGALGADRLGTSRIVKIAKGLENDGTY